MKTVRKNRPQIAKDILGVMNLAAPPGFRGYFTRRQLMEIYIRLLEKGIKDEVKK